MGQSLQGKVTVVTGVARGIGKPGKTKGWFSRLIHSSLIGKKFV